MTKTVMRVVSLFMTFALIVPFESLPSRAAAQEEAKPVFSQGELEQVLAPIALYPDSLLAQILMASTYPLEVVQADRWANQNKDLKGDALAAALEKQQWDPSVKSLVNFPQVLDMMSQKLDWTQKLGDAFLAQQKDVMDIVQQLRKKADAAGYLKTTKEQTVIVEKETQTIVIQSPSPTVVYVPAYNPTVVYGVWPYPAYPPYYYYPPGYVAGAAVFGFAAGVAIGAAWGYAWGGCNWHSGNVNINVNRNANFNRNINRGAYARQYQGGGGNWQHNSAHRKGVSYRDQATAQKFNRASTNQAIQSRENFRGRAETGRQNIARGGADQFKSSQGAAQRGGQEARAGTGGRDFSGQRSSAFSGGDRSGSATRDISNRGSSSRRSMSSGSRGAGGGGASRSGGGSRGGGRR
ncbi:MAG TPA: DUF3300 domain-containing protein [Nitrospiraceae bacterium]|nr:DUF3300 domain-containing protein [Nitrospiraceae bacterium]